MDQVYRNQKLKPLVARGLYQLSSYLLIVPQVKSLAAGHPNPTNIKNPAKTCLGQLMRIMAQINQFYSHKSFV